jgi:hypothetical protein
MQCFFRYSLKVARSNLRLRAKVDGLLLLGVYFMPVLVLLSWMVGIPLFFLHPPQWFSIFWAFIPISLYSFVGNFAPFFEVGIGTYLDNRTRAQWLIPLLIFTFLFNIFICTKALIDLTISKITRRNSNHWTKTPHSGNGNIYIKN